MVIIRISAILSTSYDHPSSPPSRTAFHPSASPPCRSRRTTVCEMLVSGGVGRIDAIVKDDAAVMRRRQLRDRLGACRTCDVWRGGGNWLGDLGGQEL